MKRKRIILKIPFILRKLYLGKYMKTKYSLLLLKGHNCYNCCCTDCCNLDLRFGYLRYLYLNSRYNRYCYNLRWIRYSGYFYCNYFDCCCYYFCCSCYWSCCLGLNLNQIHFLLRRLQSLHLHYIRRLNKCVFHCIRRWLKTKYQISHTVILEYFNIKE